MIANTHIYANPSRDFVKLAQTFCFMQHISAFLEKLEQQGQGDVPVIVCGDWNSRPRDSSIHLIMNKKFYADPVTGRQQPCQGYESYSLLNPEREQNIKLLKMLQKHIYGNLSSIQKIKGKLNSAYSLFNPAPQNYEQNRRSNHYNSTLQWAEDFTKMHPKYTNYRYNFKENIDYIFYTPSNMKVTQLLGLPDLEANILNGEK